MKRVVRVVGERFQVIAVCIISSNVSGSAKDVMCFIISGVFNEVDVPCLSPILSAIIPPQGALVYPSFNKVESAKAGEQWFNR